MPNTTASPPDLSGLVPTVYPGLDFDTISDDLTLQLQAAFSNVYNDFAISSLGVTLQDIIAYGLDILSFYLDRRATDTYLATARTPNALTTLTRQLGYKIKGAVPATVDLNVLLAGTPPSFLVPVSPQFQFQGPNSLVFEVSEAVTLYNPASPAVGTTIPAVVPCYQGQTITENFVSNGTPNQSFSMHQLPTGLYVAQGTVQVVVGGVTWFESDFLTYAQTNQFEFDYIDTPPTLNFGDGSAGNIPPAGASIVVTYVATAGQTGAVTASTGDNTIITGPVTPLTVNFQTINLNITNPASGPGFNPESTSHIQATAPFSFKSRDVAVTGEDYFAQANSYADPVFGTVAAAEAISARSAAQDLAFQQAISNLTIDVVSQQNAVASLGAVSTNNGTSTISIVASASNMTVSGMIGNIFTPASVGNSLGLSGCSNAGNNGVFLIISILMNTAGTSALSVTVTNASAVPETSTVGVKWSEITETISNLAFLATDIATQTGNGNATLSTINSDLAALIGTTGTLSTSLSTLTGDVSLLTQQNSSLASVSGEVSSAQSSVTSASTSTNGVTTNIAGFSVGSSNTITSAMQTTINNQLSSISSVLSSASSQLTLASSQLASIIAALGTGTPGQALKTDLQSLVTTLTTVTGSTIPAIQELTGAVPGNSKNLTLVLDTLTTDSSSVTLDTNTISTTLTALTATTNTGTRDVSTPTYIACYDQILSTDFGTGFGDIFAIQQHLDTIESNDSEANVISVPILAKNASGFYTAPPVALVQALQNYLVSIKEVTQTPVVVDGSAALILSGVNLVYGYTGTTQTLAQNAVQAALDGLYKNRSFGQSLYVSDIDTAIRAVPNIVYVNVKQIFAVNAQSLQPQPLDANGNLIITTNQVITEDPSLNLFTSVLVNPTSTTAV